MRKAPGARGAAFDALGGIEGRARPLPRAPGAVTRLRAGPPTAYALAMSRPVRRVEAACGECRFGLPGNGCDLAVRIDGVAYFVDGTGIDDHGDAHAGDGLCNAIRFADVDGEVVNGRFAARTFRLVPGS